MRKIIKKGLFDLNFLVYSLRLYYNNINGSVQPHAVYFFTYRLRKIVEIDIIVIS